MTRGGGGWDSRLVPGVAAHQRSHPPVHLKEGNLPTTERNLKSCTQDYQEQLHAVSTQRVRTAVYHKQGLPKFSN